MTTENLWGEIPEATQSESPKSILELQANILSEKTEYNLQGEVLSGKDEDRLFAELFIRVRSLNNFEISLVRITHDLFMYPVRLYDLLEMYGEFKECANADAFKKELSIILGSGKVKRVISSLLAQTNT